MDIVTPALRKLNRLENGSFEDDFGGIVGDTQQGEFQYSVRGKDACDGRKCGEITVVKPGWGRMVMPVNGLDPAKEYVLLAAVKTTDGADMASLWYLAEGDTARLFRIGPRLAKLRLKPPRGPGRRAPKFSVRELGPVVQMLAHGVQLRTAGGAADARECRACRKMPSRCASATQELARVTRKAYSSPAALDSR